MKNLKEKAEGANLQVYLTTIFESIIGSEATETLEILSFSNWIIQEECGKTKRHCDSICGLELKKK